MSLSNQPKAFDYQAAGPGPVVQVFTASGVWKKPPGVNIVRICAWGGGGRAGGGIRNT